MLRGALATFTVVATFAPFLLSPSESGAAHGHRHRYHRYHRHHGLYFSYGPGYYSAFGFGYAHPPFSIGFAFAGGPPDDWPSVRFHVHPKQTEIYVDGYFAGIVDDFDGSKRLRLDPGAHEITLYLDGHRMHRQLVNPGPGNEVRLRHDMEPQLPGEPKPVRPSAGTPSASVPTPTSSTVPSSAPPPAPAPASTELASLVVRAQPADVLIIVNGEPWSAPPGADSLTLHLPAGRHRVEIEKEGYETFRTQVDLSPGESTDLNVQLGPGSR
ncbi:MAG TPA: PEGA domain-containing protein [Vicinamibacteria bacterium]|nr:PEGA domain-containing protein [Vicinamibacteria bacterium]